MIQRIQTLFLLLAFIVVVLCLALPIGRYIAMGEGVDFILYNNQVYAISDSNILFPLYPYAILAILLLLACPLTLWTIFKYKNRMLQAMLCSSLMVLMILWVAWYVYVGYCRGIEGTAFHPSFAAVLPVIALILFAMARRGILSDEKRVRDADRIR